METERPSPYSQVVAPWVPRTQCWGCTADPQRAMAEPCGAGGEGSNLCPVVTWDSGLHFEDERMTSD